jgi:acyl-homoserine lactone acylase PvdQ
VTAGLADNVDLDLEQTGEDDRSVREGDQFVPCQVRQETIHVKGKPPIVKEILVTPRGPVVLPDLDGALDARGLDGSTPSARGARPPF